MADQVSDFYGPPQASPFDQLSPERRAQFDKALAIADGVQFYNRAGGIGAAAHWKPYAQELERRGGLSEEEALTLGRYRMWKQGLPVPTTYEPDPTPEEIAARRDQLFASDTATRAQMIDEDNRRIFESQQKFFHSLIKPKKEESKPNETTPIKLAKTQGDK